MKKKISVGAIIVLLSSAVGYNFSPEFAQSVDVVVNEVYNAYVTLTAPDVVPVEPVQ